jgi:Ras GTPase-activating-like protein IQGAP2/3
VRFLSWNAEQFSVAEVEHPEGYFQANEVIEASREARPISVTRAEVYGMLAVLKKHQGHLVSGPKMVVVDN